MANFDAQGRVRTSLPQKVLVRVQVRSGMKPVSLDGICSPFRLLRLLGGMMIFFFKLLDNLIKVIERVPGRFEIEIEKVVSSAPPTGAIVVN
jgi:hypothetical protein